MFPTVFLFRHVKCIYVYETLFIESLLYILLFILSVKNKHTIIIIWKNTLHIPKAADSSDDYCTSKKSFLWLMFDE